MNDIYRQLKYKFLLAGLVGFLLTMIGVWVAWEYITGDSFTLNIIFRSLIIHEPWSWRSVDYHKGISQSLWPLSPVTAIVLWIGISAILLLAFKITRIKKVITYGLATFIFAGWLVLDIRWQWELMARLKETYTQFGNLNTSDKAVSMDANILMASKKILSQLPKNPVRLFIVLRDGSRNYSKYFSYRLFYYLLPHRASVVLPESLARAKFYPNDFILFTPGTTSGNLIRPRADIFYNSDKLSLDLHYIVPGAGTLYRISKGE